MAAKTEQTQDNGRRKAWRFKDRWRIEGVLFTQSSLHIGSGEMTAHPELTVDGQPVEVAACIKNYQGLPMIPGASLKGCLRAWLESACKVKAIFNQVFGEGPSGDSGAAEDDQGSGGTAEFHDAHLEIARTGETPLPHWNTTHHTWIEVTNSIRRDTHTAADEHLIHRECVPAGVGFQVVVTGFFDDEQAALILAGLNGFNAEDHPVTLGADTASCKGCFRWETGTVYRMDVAAVHDWVNNPDRCLAEKALPALDPDVQLKLENKYSTQQQIPTNTIVFGITLNFDSHFLVNDPPDPEKSGTENDSHPPDHRPRVNEMHKVILPAKSFRGAFRGQAERILRTLALDGREVNQERYDYVYRKIACRPEDRRFSCKPIQQVKAKGSLCLACQLFGAPGWKTPLQVSDFKILEGTGTEMTQHFVAIDRFTGGGKGGAKFSAVTVYKPSLAGCVSLDRDRADDDWSLGLLALVLRDLTEGDINFGFGAAKGYGSCSAQISIGDPVFKKDAPAALIALRKKVENIMKKAPAGDESKEM